MDTVEDTPFHARIVVADDFAPIRFGLKALLGDSVCGEAANGQEAVEKVLELHPDLILLDLSMPVKDGLQAAREIRALAPRTKILIFTLYDSVSVRGGAFHAGADAFLRKDSPSGKVLEAVKQLITPLGLEIFRIEKDGTLMWCDTVGTFEAAKARIEQLRRLRPSPYMVLSLKTGYRTVFPMPVPLGRD